MTRCGAARGAAADPSVGLGTTAAPGSHSYGTAEGAREGEREREREMQENDINAVLMESRITKTKVRNFGPVIFSCSVNLLGIHSVDPNKIAIDKIMSIRGEQEIGDSSLRLRTLHYLIHYHIHHIRLRT